MPIKRCGSNRKGYKFGRTGKCYPSKKKAIKQMVAIKIKTGEIKVRRKKR